MNPAFFMFPDPADAVFRAGGSKKAEVRMYNLCNLWYSVLGQKRIPVRFRKQRQYRCPQEKESRIGNETVWENNPGRHTAEDF